MSSMMLVIMTIVLATGLGLIAAGAWYQLNRNRLGSDPVLIRSCYLFGSMIIASNLAIPVLG